MWLAKTYDGILVVLLSACRTTQMREMNEFQPFKYMIECVYLASIYSQMTDSTHLNQTIFQEHD